MNDPGRTGQPDRPQPPQGPLYAARYQPGGYQRGGWGGPVAAARTNTMAILAICFAFFMPVLGIVFGAVARRQIARSGEEGYGLATAGLVIGVVYCVLLVLACAAYAAFVVVLVTQAHRVGTHLGPFPSPFPTAVGGALGV